MRKSDTTRGHLNASTLEQLNEILAQPSSGDDPERKVRELSERYMQFTTEYANLWSVLFEHVWPRDQAMPTWYPVRIRRLLGVLAKAMEPLFPSDSEQKRLQAAAVLWSSLHGIHSLAASGKMGLISSESVTDMSEMLIHNFVAGLSQRATGLAQS